MKLQVTDVRTRSDVQGPDVRAGSESVNLARVRGSGHPEKVGRPVVPGAPDVRKVSVVRGSGSTRDASFRMRFWAEFGDFGVKIDEISWMEDGET